MKNIIVLDIDRCILDPSARIHHYLQGDIQTYESLWYLDQPISQGLVVYKSFLESRIWRCVFVTSRRERARHSTTRQLLELFGPANYILLMRPNDCDKEMKDDASIKPWLMEQAGYKIEDIFMAFDDRQAVVDRWRELGVVCYQTAPDVGT